jgi:hypothetical protein
MFNFEGQTLYQNDVDEIMYVQNMILDNGHTKNQIANTDSMSRRANMAQLRMLPKAYQLFHQKNHRYA